MNWFTQTLSSTLGKKLVMGITGLFLILFLIVHCGVNSLIFFNDDGQMFNKAAEFMATNFFIRVGEVVLFAGLIWHVVQSLVVTLTNAKARPQGYAKFANSSPWYSRSMGLLGTLILIFLIIHLSHFWVVSRFGELNTKIYGSEKVGNLYFEMQEVFSKLWVVILYDLAMVSLAYHLMHGFQSAFQTLGINHKKYTPLIQTIGIIYSILLPLLFAAMPVVIYLRVTGVLQF
jgi:succinate dehydrogenase / fumarate reductase cytochrome b subunit